MTTILKIRSLHIWVSGSAREPYSHLWLDDPKASCGYRGVAWKPSRSRFGRIYLSNETPAIVKWYLGAKSRYIYYGYGDPEEKPTPRPSFPIYLIGEIWSEIRERFCRHDFEVEEDISSESGPSGYYSCRKCGKSGSYGYGF